MTAINNVPATIERVRGQIARSEDVGELVDLRDKLVALQKLMEARGETLEKQNELAAVRLESERRAGQLLSGMKIHGRGRKAKGNSVLDELGITRWHSMNWQVIAAIPEDSWTWWLETESRGGGELSTKSAYQFGRRFKPSKRKSPTRSPGFGETPKKSADMALGVISRLFLDVKRSLDDRPHTAITPERILRAGDAIRELRAFLRHR